MSRFSSLKPIAFALLFSQWSGAETFDDTFDSGDINERWLIQRNTVGSVELDQEDGMAVVTATGANANGGLASLATFNPTTEGINVTFVISEVIGNPNANGFLVGVVDDNEVFHRNTNNFGIAMFGQEPRTFSAGGYSLIAGDRNGSSEADHIIDEGDDVDLESYFDGFTVMISADQSGWSYRLEGLQDFDLNDVVFENSGTWDEAGTSFEEIFGEDDEWHVVTADQSPGEKITFFDQIVLGPTGEPEDSDGDGMTDTWEEANGLDPESDDAAGDADGDTLTNLQEFTLGTDPQDSDTDGDTLSDGDEVNTHETNPKSADSDDDALNDGAELTEFETSPTNADSDRDGVEDGIEALFGGAPLDAETGVGTFLVRNVAGDVGTLTSMDAFVDLLETPADILDEKTASSSFVNFRDTSQGKFANDEAFPLLGDQDLGFDDFGLHVTGTIFIKEAGVRTFGANSDDGNLLLIDGEIVVDDSETHGARDAFGAVDLSAGTHTFEFFYFERGGGSHAEVFVNAELGEVDSFGAGNFVLLPAFGTAVNDGDGDGLRDIWEMQFFGNLDQTAEGDPDGDTLSNATEQETRTFPNNKDTDGDTLDDNVELASNPPTDPRRADTDSDGLDDSTEKNLGTNPTLADTDGDNLSDKWEIDNGTNPANDASPAGITLADLGEATETWNEIQPLPTFDGYDGGLDTADATFRVCIDFDTKQDEEREVIFETGAGTIGFSLVYEEGNELVLRADGNGGLSLAVASATLSPETIAAGEVELLWSYDVENETGTQTITLWLDQFPIASVAMDLGGDWSGANGASFGAASGSIAGTGTNGSLAGGDFLSGTINLEKGLQFFGETVPEIVSIDRGGGGGFAITKLVRNPTNKEVSVTWPSSPGATYSIDSSTDLTEWLEVQDGVESEGTETTFTQTDEESENYYRVRKED